MRLAAAALVLGALFLAGCLESPTVAPKAPLPDCAVPNAFLVPSDGRLPLQGENRIDLVFFAPREPARFTEVILAPKWKWEHQELSGGTTNGTFLRFSVKPGAAQAAGARPPEADGTRPGAMSLNWTSQGAFDGTCKGAADGSFALSPDLAAAANAATRGSGGPGKGAYVRYAGFYTNGTLFGTNIKAVEDMTGWPRAGFYKFDADQPLNVYIYDKDRTEGDASPLWNPKDPQGNYPAWRYFTTIPGFNAALKGLPSLLPKVVVLEPKDAYPDRGLLKGERLVFYIVLEETVDVPCPSQVPNRSTCRSSLSLREDEAPR